MKPIVATRLIQAPLDQVFETISDVRNFRNAVAHIVRIEFLTEQQTGVGTRFRETRLMNGREASVEIEVTEFVTNEKVRMVSDAGGTVWDSVFSTGQVGDDVELQLQMNVEPYRLFAKIINPLIRGMVVKGVESDMDAVKEYCEQLAMSSTEPP